MKYNDLPSFSKQNKSALVAVLLLVKVKLLVAVLKVRTPEQVRSFRVMFQGGQMSISRCAKGSRIHCELQHKPYMGRTECI